MEELEKAKLLAVAQKIVKSSVNEVRDELLEQINKIQLITPAASVPGRGIIDVALIEEELVLQFNDGSFANLGRIIGEQGIQGFYGEQGTQGEQGITGEQGIPGEQGISGIQGEQGIQGDKGDRGDQGPRGEKGEKGDTGDRGEQGISGERGERGEQGPAAIDGADGRAGRDGAKGDTGERGPQGVPSRDGKEGKDGIAGPKGDKGYPGEKGDKGDPGSDAEVSKLEKKLSEFSEQVDKRLSKVAFNVAAKGGPAGSGEVNLYRLDDVDYNTVKIPTNGQALVWNVSIGKWAAGTVAGGGATNVAPYLQVANAVAIFQTISIERVALANTNLAITNVKTGLTSTNTALRTLVSDRLQVANASATYQTIAIERTALANTNSFIKSQLANTNTYIATKVNTTIFNSALANTNSFIKSQLANTNLAITNVKTGLTSTNTALRTLISDRLQVANAATLYTTKSNPTTSGLLAHTGRATISTNLTITGNTIISGLIANGALGTSGYVLKTNGSTVYWGTAGGGGSTDQYISVVNANALFATKAYAAANSYVKSVLANTNLAIINVKTGLTTTNTALRALDTAKLQVANSFTKLTKYAANTSAVTTTASSVKLNDALTVNPAGLLTIQLPDGSTVKIPYWN